MPDDDEELDIPLDELEPDDILVDGKYYQGNENILRTKNATFKWTPAMQEEVKLCIKSILHFAEQHFYIITLDDGKQKIQLYKYQKRLLKAFKANRFNVVLSSRQSGKTTTITIYALWLVCFQADKRVTIVANKESTAKEIFSRIRTAYEMLPIYLKPAIKSWRKDGLNLTNGSAITISTTSAAGPRGGSSNLLLIDEMAFCPPEIMNELWKSAIPIIIQSKKSQITVISTANGVDNKFYQLFRDAQKPESIWHSERVEWWDVPGRDEKWKKDAMELLAEEGKGEESFDQEFGNQFIVPGRTVIDPELLEQLKNCPEPILAFEEGRYLVYKLPEPGKQYVMGVDVGEGIGRSNTVAQVFDITDLQQIEQVATFASKDISPYHFGTRLLGLLNDWGRCPVLVENNNYGMQVLDVLYHTHNYENIVTYAQEGNSVHYNTGNRKGVHAHTTTKYHGVSNFRYWCNSLKAVKFNNAETVQELHTFVRLPNQMYSKRTDKDLDDRVMSSIWALFILIPNLVQNYFSVLEIDDQGRPKVIRAINDNSELLKQSPLIVGQMGKLYRNRHINVIPAMINPKPAQRDPYGDDAKDLWMWLHTQAFGGTPPEVQKELTTEELESMYKEEYSPIVLF